MQMDAPWSCAARTVEAGTGLAGKARRGVVNGSTVGSGRERHGRWGAVRTSLVRHSRSGHGRTRFGRIGMVMDCVDRWGTA
jgi:hypothetical protein